MAVLINPSCMLGGGSFASIVPCQHVLELEHEIINQSFVVMFDELGNLVSCLIANSNLENSLTSLSSSAMIASIVKTVQLRAITEKGDATCMHFSSHLIDPPFFSWF
jgi:hypothetical protein